MRIAHPAVRTDASKAATEPATPGRPSPGAARYEHRRRVVPSGHLVVDSDTQALARLGGSNRHLSKSLREFRPGAAKGLDEGVDRVEDVLSGHRAPTVHAREVREAHAISTACSAAFSTPGPACADNSMTPQRPFRSKGTGARAASRWCTRCGPLTCAKPVISRHPSLQTPSTPVDAGLAVPGAWGSERRYPPHQ
jgi:hypothetical protein